MTINLKPPKITNQQPPKKKKMEREIYREEDIRELGLLLLRLDREVLVNKSLGCLLTIILHYQYFD